jgi:hypothetical protein
LPHLSVCMSYILFIIIIIIIIYRN